MDEKLKKLIEHVTQSHSIANNAKPQNQQLVIELTKAMIIICEMGLEAETIPQHNHN